MRVEQPILNWQFFTIHVQYIHVQYVSNVMDI